jgi:hypothetical protein
MKAKSIFRATALLAPAIALFLFFTNKQKTAALNEPETEVAEREANGADKQLDNWFWQKGYPNPQNLSLKYQQGWQEYLDLKNNAPANLSRGTNAVDWTAIGPKVFGGRVLSLAVNRLANTSGSRTLFAGSASGGIWKSYSAGVGATAWQPVVTGTPVLGVASIVYHPVDTAVLLAGTGEVYRVDTVVNGASSYNQTGNIGRVVWKTRGSYGIGILRSADGGNTWVQVLGSPITSLFGIQKIKFDPTNSSIVYACATDGLYKSIDAGVSFTKVLSLTYVNDIVINPANNQQLLIVNGNLNRTDKGIWRSINGGTSFTKLTPAGFPTSAQYKGFVSLSIAGTAAPYTVFAGVGKGDVITPNSYSENEVYRTTDFGSNWSLISSSNHSSFQAWFAHCITPFPVTGGTSNTKIFMAGVNKFVLSISGTTGTATSIGTGSATTNTYLGAGAQEGSNTYVHADVHDIQFVPGSVSEAYFATDGGVFRTTNANVSPASGIRFASCNGGLQIQQFYPTAAQSQTNPTLFVGGLQDNNVVRSRGTAWARVIGGDGGPCLFKPDNEAILLGSTDARGVSRSVDSGKTYGANVLSYLGSLSSPNDDRAAFMSPFAVGRANTNIWYAGSDNIHVSTNAGLTFSNNGVPGTAYIEALHKTAIAMAVSDLNANKLYVSVSPFAQNTSTYGLWYTPPANIRKSINGGTSFTTATGTLPDRIFTDVTISPTNDDSVFVTLGGFGTTHVYVTGDGGATWTPRGSGLPDVPFNCILIDAANTNILYAGCDFGVYVSNDRGANWYDYNNGFWDATYVMDLVLAPGNKLRAVTHGKGIFETTRWDGFVLPPVVFTSFTGVNENDMNKLNWLVSKENGLLRYEIERSTDGFKYTTLGQVNARNSNNSQQYTFNDKPASGIPVVSYYRLRLIHANGSHSYSGILVLRKILKYDFTILGNPFIASLNIRYTIPSLTPLHFRLYDVQGILLRNEYYKPPAVAGSYSITGLENLTPGIYILNVEVGSYRKSLRVVKE